ncbi:hypothetical protein [Laceyella putida]|uniref:Uncharacterized protein n=1 Tax=Laceyella putida TaxID=110101 RepID=A0ABW2RKW2_9BACL
MEILPKLSANYTYLTEDIAIFEGSYFYLFFQNNSIKKAFLLERDEAPAKSPQFHRALGHALGFPPKAVAHYASIVELQENGHDPVRLEEMKAKRIGLQYCGIHCSSSMDHLEENVLWLWERYEYDGLLHIRVETALLPVKYGDLREVRAIAQSLTVHTPTAKIG